MRIFILRITYRNETLNMNEFNPLPTYTKHLNIESKKQKGDFISYFVWKKPKHFYWKRRGNKWLQLESK